ncbi:MAG: hypothetical protein FGM47_03230 [Candidatus Nanopelagicaceae bacterium]|nr:hypothetical protein [Candidatus Nanopelagicaceae bacterium]
MKTIRYWIALPILLSLSVMAIWGTAHFGPIGKPSQQALECQSVRELIIAQEVEGKAAWTQYRKLVDEYLSLAVDSQERIPLVENMASAVIVVLGHDLTIYKELEKFPKCVLRSKREQIPSLVEETQAAINFLSGSTAIDGTYFDPKAGSWNATYYEEFLTAQDFLIGTSKEPSGTADL